MQALLADNAEITKDAYQRLPNISIDYAIMEKTAKIVVLPSAFGWSDIGSWKSLYDFLPKDQNRNVIDGDVVAHATRNCFIMARDRLIASNALDGLVLVETPDAIFVSDMDSSRDVKAIVAQLKLEERPEYRKHNVTYHAWGSTSLLEEKVGYRVRRLVLYPGATHKMKAGDQNKKQVFIVQGTATVRQDGEEQTQTQSSGFVILSAHCADVANEQAEPLTLIEITFRGSLV
jgi:mannose-6-phosphate isomerase-like protein (cupin superfamily)